MISGRVAIRLGRPSEWPAAVGEPLPLVLSADVGSTRPGVADVAGACRAAGGTTTRPFGGSDEVLPGGATAGAAPVEGRVAGSAPPGAVPRLPHARPRPQGSRRLSRETRWLSPHRPPSRLGRELRARRVRHAGRALRRRSRGCHARSGRCGQRLAVAHRTLHRSRPATAEGWARGRVDRLLRLGPGHDETLRRREHRPRRPCPGAHRRCLCLTARGPRRDHRPLQDPLGRSDAVNQRRSETRRRGRDLRRARERLQPLPVHLDGARVGDRTAAKTCSIDGHDRARHDRVPVHGDVLHAHHGGVANDHVVHDARPSPTTPRRSVDRAPVAPPRHDRLAPPERHPAHRRPRSDNDTTRVTEEGHESGGIHGPGDHGAGRPGPVPVHEAPASVVVRGPAPRRRVHPGPAVHGVDDPRPCAVRRPPGRHAGRHPDGPVGGDHPPGAMRVQVAQSVGAGGDVARAHGVEEPIGPGVVPSIPVVERRSRVRRQLGAHRPLDHQLLARRNGHRLPAGRRDRGSAALARHDPGALARGVHAVIARLPDRDGGVGSVHFHGVSRLQGAKVEHRAAGHQRELDEVRILIGETELRVRPGADEGARADLDLQGSGRARRKHVAGRERSVDLRSHPVLRTGSPERDPSVGEAKPGRCLLESRIRWIIRPNARRRADRQNHRQHACQDRHAGSHARRLPVSETIQPARIVGARHRAVDIDAPGVRPLHASNPAPDRRFSTSPPCGDAHRTIRRIVLDCRGVPWNRGHSL